MLNSSIGHLHSINGNFGPTGEGRELVRVFTYLGVLNIEIYKLFKECRQIHAYYVSLHVISLMRFDMSCGQ